MSAEKYIVCPIHGIDCNFSDCQGTLPVRFHEDGTDHVDGMTRYRLVCTNGDTPYEIPISYTRAEIEKAIYDFTKKHQASSSIIQSSSETTISGNNTQHKKARHKGTSIFDGIRVHQDIESDSRKSFFKVNQMEFKLTREIDWIIADRILEAIRDRIHDYEISLSSKEYNGLSPEGKKLVRYILDREEVSKKVGNQKHSGKARIKPNAISIKNI